jgi:hypothetical protein
MLVFGKVRELIARKLPTGSSGSRVRLGGKPPGDGLRPAYSVEKLVSEAHTILQANTKLTENPQ